MEDYKKKYKEALERARQIQNTPYTAHWDVMKEVVEDIFPELKESEDERIRKELLKIAKESEDSFYMVMTPRKRESLISWLEKQGEQRPAWSEEDEVCCSDVNAAISDYFDEGYAEELKDWLKSLKERMKGE